MSGTAAAARPTAGAKKRKATEPACQEDQSMADTRHRLMGAAFFTSALMVRASLRCSKTRTGQQSGRSLLSPPHAGRRACVWHCFFTRLESSSLPTVSPPDNACRA